MNKPSQLVSSLFEHSTAAMQQLVNDIELGCPGRLALAHAIVGLRIWRMGNQPDLFHPSGDRRAMRLMQALQLAVSYYQSAAALEAVGQAQCDAYVQDFLSLIRDMSIA